MERTADILTRICDAAGRIAAVFMVALVFVIMYDVIGRKFFATGSVMIHDLQWHMHGVVAMFAFGYTYTRNAHVRIDVTAHRYNPRFRLWLELLVVLFLVIPFFLLIAWYGYTFAERAFVRGEGANGGRGLPYRWIVKSIVPVSALLTIAGCLAVCLRIWVVLWSGGETLTDAFIERPLWKR